MLSKYLGALNPNVLSFITKDFMLSFLNHIGINLAANQLHQLIVSN